LQFGKWESAMQHDVETDVHLERRQEASRSAPPTDFADPSRVAELALRLGLPKGTKAVALVMASTTVIR
jgi:hypothetical protein